MGFVEVVKGVLGITQLEDRLERAEVSRELAQSEAKTLRETARSLQDQLRSVEAARDRAESERDETTKRAAAELAAAYSPPDGPATPVEPAWQACGCGSTSARVELLLAKLAVVGGHLVRTEAGAVCTCARCGRRWAIDADGVFMLHRGAWPSPWIVEAQLEAQEQAREQQREAARQMRSRRNGNSVAGDMRFPPS